MTHQMWCNQPFSQRKKGSKSALGAEVGGEGGGLGQNLKKEG